MADGEKVKLLLVEDDVFMIELLGTSLGGAGFDIAIAQSGEQALGEFKKRTPDLVLLDLLLPDMHGFEVLKKIRALPGGDKTKVIVLSNLSGTDDINEAKRLGAVDYLVKANFSLPEIADKVRAALK